MSQHYSLNAKIEQILSENKKGVKTYASYGAAAKAIEKEISDYLNAHNEGQGIIGYSVLYIPAVEKFTPVVDYTKFIERHRIGGYIGYFACRGFMQT